MAPFGIFGKKEKAKKTEVQTQESLLERLCQGDEQLYNVMTRTLLLDAEKTKSHGDIDARASRAEEYERNKDNVRAAVEYQTAGELALYEGKVALVQKFFKKAMEADPTNLRSEIFKFFAKKESAEKAVAVAREYYAQKVAKYNAKEA
jgi:hypothetical protein